MKAGLMWFCMVLFGVLGLSKLDIRVSLGDPSNYFHMEFPRALERPWLVLDIGQKPGDEVVTECGEFSV